MKITHALATILTGATLAAAGTNVAIQHRAAAPLPDRPTHTLTAPIGNHSERWAGNDRYTTAVDISRSAGWDNTNTTVVYLATGLNYPDALALGASTGGGPILFAKPGDLTDATRFEIRRLVPCTIIAVGGSDVISDAVVTEADNYTMAPTQEKCAAA